MRFTIKTIGCKVNTYESEKIKNELIRLGFSYVDVEDKDLYKSLDCYIVNTCSVTNVADKKSRQMIHLAKKCNAKVLVIAIGCTIDSMAVREGASVEKVKNEVAETLGADIVLSNDEKEKLPDILKKYIDNSLDILSNQDYRYKMNYDNEDISVVENTKESIDSYPRTRSFIKIQDGCDEYCTYCIIPYLRGHIRSRSDDEILEEIRKKVISGVKEVVLTGIHISSFGLDRIKKNYENAGAISIARDNIIALIEKIADIKVNISGGSREVIRIRLGSLEPRLIDEKFLKKLTETDGVDKKKYILADKFCPNFCLSLQSGSDKILKLMNRHYTTDDFRKACELIRKYMPDATITADVIVGFPGETEQDFEDSLRFVKEMRFYNPNIFPYSIREGTKAATFDNQIASSVKRERARRMIEECKKQENEIVESLLLDHDNYAQDSNSIMHCDNLERTDKKINIGDIVDGILVEEIVLENGNKYAIGYTKNYIKRRIKI